MLLLLLLFFGWAGCLPCLNCSTGYVQMGEKYEFDTCTEDRTQNCETDCVVLEGIVHFSDDSVKFTRVSSCGPNCSALIPTAQTLYANFTPTNYSCSVVKQCMHSLFNETITTRPLQELTLASLLTVLLLD
jgi:hypothetical protein